MSNILQRNWLIAHKLEDAMRTASGTTAGNLLDMGCGNKPYAGVFSKHVRNHIGIDMPGSTLIDNTLDAFAKVEELPFRGETFDCVICSEVLQYVPSPQAAVKEAFRVLKKNGVFIVTATQMWHITNSPLDCYRFTEFGLKYLAETAGFRLKDHRRLGGFWLRMGLKLCYFAHRFNVSKALDLPIRISLIVPQFFFRVLDRIFFDEKDIIINFMVFERS